MNKISIRLSRDSQEAAQEEDIHEGDLRHSLQRLLSQAAASVTARRKPGTRKAITRPEKGYWRAAEAARVTATRPSRRSAMSQRRQQTETENREGGIKRRPGIVEKIAENIAEPLPQPERVINAARRQGEETTCTESVHVVLRGRRHAVDTDKHGRDGARPPEQCGA